MAFELGDLLCFWPFPRGRARPWVQAGNVFRDAGDWAQAATNYRRATAIEPRRRAIWVQLGHMEKEAGAPQKALEAYRHASTLYGQDGDAPFHLGNLAIASGDMDTARWALDQALRENPAHGDARRERLALAHLPAAITSAANEKAAALFSLEQERWQGDLPAIIFDASDLLIHFRHARLPTGIQRVQIEIINGALASQPGTQICVFIEEPGGWAAIPVQLFQSLCSLSVAAGDIVAPEWLEAIEILTSVLDRACPPYFGPGASLVNLGTSCQHQNYFLHIRVLQQRHGLRYIPFVHDLIPVLAPHFCVEGLVEDFLGWTAGVFDHAFAFLTNSHATCADLRKVAALYGHTLEPERVAVIPLDADFRAKQRDLPNIAMLKSWGVASGGYVLFVSTIEVRKNHVLALQAWLELIALHGPDMVPDLICVGRKGWLSDDVWRLLDDNPGLAKKVRIFSNLSDIEIALLYSHCSFTLYPSHYEGWGLPVTESLCYGKVPMISRSSSLPEAGGDLAVYIDSDRVESLTAAVERLWFQPALREALEARIVAQFHPRSWIDLAWQINQALENFILALPDIVRTPPLTVFPEVLYQMARNRLSRPLPHAGDGERWRHGTGWDAPDEEGSRTRLQGGDLLVDVETFAEHPWCCLRLRAIEIEAMDVLVTANGNGHSFVFSAGETHCVAVPIAAGRLQITIRGMAGSGTGSKNARVELSRMIVMENMPGHKDDLAQRMSRDR